MTSLFYLMLTGRDIDLYFSQKSDISYSAYLDQTKKNRLFKNAMFVCCDKKYLNLEDQKTFDEMAALISTENVFSVNNNKIYTSPLQITNIQFNTPSVNIATITTALPNNLRDGETVTISGVLSNPALTNNINGSFVATIASATTFTIPYVYVAGTYTPNTGQVTYAEMVSDYMHLYAVKCKYLEPLNIPVNNSSGVSPISIFFKIKNKIRSGDQIIISGATHNLAMNGTWYVKQISSVGYYLYQDADFLIPSTGGVAYSLPEGTVSKISYEYAKPNFSDRKIDQFNESEVDLPKYETANKLLKFYPTNRSCSEITLDYITVPKVFIDVTDNSTDLSLVYPEKYLYWIIDMSIKLFSTPLRDTLLNQEITQELVLNP